MYTSATNKYRANELLNESSKRAIVIATQILSGKSISADMMNQFDNNGSTFTGVEAVGTNQFKLTLSGVDADGTSACDGEGVCNSCPTHSYALSYGGIESTEETNKPGCYCIQNYGICPGDSDKICIPYGSVCGKARK